MENHNHQALIQKLLDCALTCENCATACLQEEDVQMMTHCISLDRDCSDLCFQAARLLKRGSDVGHRFLSICEEICRKCADECSKHEAQHCKDCAKCCVECAEACHAHHKSIKQD